MDLTDKPEWPSGAGTRRGRGGQPTHVAPRYDHARDGRRHPEPDAHPAAAHRACARCSSVCRSIPAWRRASPPSFGAACPRSTPRSSAVSSRSCSGRSRSAHPVRKAATEALARPTVDAAAAARVLRMKALATLTGTTNDVEELVVVVAATSLITSGGDRAPSSSRVERAPCGSARGSRRSSAPPRPAFDSR
jgi:hypothetical protein